jgi:hypothetical protein
MAFESTIDRATCRTASLFSAAANARRALRSATRCRHARHQFGKSERFSQVVADARIEVVHSIVNGTKPASRMPPARSVRTVLSRLARALLVARGEVSQDCRWAGRRGRLRWIAWAVAQGP